MDLVAVWFRCKNLVANKDLVKVKDSFEVKDSVKIKDNFEVYDQVIYGKYKIKDDVEVEIRDQVTCGSYSNRSHDWVTCSL